MATKSEFIYKYLQPLVKALDEDIKSLIYVKSANGEEYIYINLNEKYFHKPAKICITKNTNTEIVHTILRGWFE